MVEHMECPRAFLGNRNTFFFLSVKDTPAVLRVDWSNVSPAINSRNTGYAPKTERPTIFNKPVQWKAKAKVDHDNRRHQPGGGHARAGRGAAELAPGRAAPRGVPPPPWAPVQPAPPAVAEAAGEPPQNIVHTLTDLKTVDANIYDRMY